MTTKSTNDTAAPAADTSNKPTAKAKASKPKAKADPATALEGILRDQWASTLRAAATDVKRGADLGDIARQLVRLADALKVAAKAVAQ